MDGIGLIAITGVLCQRPLDWTYSLEEVVLLLCAVAVKWSVSCDPVCYRTVRCVAVVTMHVGSEE